MKLLASMLTVLALAACGGGGDGDEGGPAPSPTSSRCEAEYLAASEAYDAAVEEWNAKVEAGAKGRFATFDEWATAEGRPTESPTPCP